jgi:hypothetical protein
VRDYTTKAITPFLGLVLFTGGLTVSLSTTAAPPYKTTDTGTADPGVLEARFGLVQAARNGDSNEVLSPLLRANYGLATNLELVSEFEYAYRDHEFEQGALGAKWRLLSAGAFSMGIETLALLPVRPGDSELGVESQLLLSWGAGNSRLHVNVGGFHDPRRSDTIEGWRGSILAERRAPEFRHGVELFARQKGGEPTEIRLGYGFVRALGGFDVRSGLHLGVTEHAPDVTFNLWFSRNIRLL